MSSDTVATFKPCFHHKSKALLGRRDEFTVEAGEENTVG